MYSTNTGRYTRIGNRVFVDVLLTGDGGAEGAGTGLVAIALPIAISASAPVNTINRPIGTAYNNASYYYILGEFIQSASTVRLYYETLFTAQTSFTGAEQNNANRAILLSFNYEV